MWFANWQSDVWKIQILDCWFKSHISFYENYVSLIWSCVRDTNPSLSKALSAILATFAPPRAIEVLCRIVKNRRYLSRTEGKRRGGCRKTGYGHLGADALFSFIPRVLRTMRWKRVSRWWYWWRSWGEERSILYLQWVFEALVALSRLLTLKRRVIESPSTCTHDQIAEDEDGVLENEALRSKRKEILPTQESAIKVSRSTLRRINTIVWSLISVSNMPKIVGPQIAEVRSNSQRLVCTINSSCSPPLCPTRTL